MNPELIEEINSLAIQHGLSNVLHAILGITASTWDFYITAGEAELARQWQTVCEHIEKAAHLANKP